MSRPTRPESGPDWQAIAGAVDQLREMLRAAVAALIADGFTDEQARGIVAATIITGRKR